jgi:hypothetical protein
MQTGDDHCGCQYLHLGALVLEPELDLERLQAQPPAQLLPLLVVRVWELLEEPASSSMHLQHYQRLKRKLHGSQATELRI